MTPPPELERGPQWARNAYNALRTFSIATQPVGGRGTDISQSENGTAVNVGNLQTLDLRVCVDGEEKVVTFYVQTGPSDPPA